jgi:hypothetical protein
MISNLNDFYSSLVHWILQNDNGSLSGDLINKLEDEHKTFPNELFNHITYRLGGCIANEDILYNISRQIIPMCASGDKK